MKKRLFIDYNGTLVEFKNVPFEELFTPGYFASLFTFDNVIDGITEFHKNYPEVELYILSKVLNEKTAMDTDKVIQKHFPFIDKDHRIYVPSDENKSDYFKITKNDFLLDDYTKNLIEWEHAGGTGIKLVNGINSRCNKWKGAQTDKDFPYTIIEYKLEQLIIKEKNK